MVLNNIKLPNVNLEVDTYFGLKFSNQSGLFLLASVANLDCKHSMIVN